eukprot:scaffold30434_cov29-Tisochrysis_lutea.AAC.6
MAAVDSLLPATPARPPRPALVHASVRPSRGSDRATITTGSPAAASATVGRAATAVACSTHSVPDASSYASCAATAAHTASRTSGPDASSLSWSTAPRHCLTTLPSRPAPCPLTAFLGPTLTWSSGAEKRSSTLLDGEGGDRSLAVPVGVSVCEDQWRTGRAEPARREAPEHCAQRECAPPPLLPLSRPHLGERVLLEERPDGEEIEQGDESGECATEQRGARGASGWPARL